MESVPRIEVKDPESGAVQVRSAVTMAFFIDADVYRISGQLEAVFDEFVRNAPRGRLAWAVVSATSEEWRKVDSAAVQRMRDSLGSEGARKRKLTAFELNDSGSAAPSIAFKLAGKPADKSLTDSSTLLQIIAPIDGAQGSEAKATAARFERWVDLLLPRSAYCSPALVPWDSSVTSAFGEIRKIALRYPGFDVAMNDMTRIDLGDRSRGARWLSYLGPALSEKLGGYSAVRQSLPATVDVEERSGGCLIQAGETPEIGDVNRRGQTPLLRAVAALLEPVTLFSEVDLLSHFAQFDEELLRRWERRFLD